MFDLMFQPLRKYADFQGRARRSEYWFFWLFQAVVSFLLCIVAMIVAGGDPQSGAATAVYGLLGLFCLALLIPSLAVAFRRLHDTNRSAWWLFIALVPFVGGLVLFIFYVLDGTPGDNRFGPDPKGRG
ncbi:DUF805 domain-containing protein [Caulobacter mirabilis]|uniref:DUF805 domain-containing protein n=1 Tax=Caulobacter mirabilis TaxID=69666 RepID=A0A2D2AWY9_9CAUL|nr:DUF805 domain-containing protein [Caulobacter mirabilis]ATQ42530.1 hypothetical protein CSW64_08970 [Caulobacter mirabilis]